MDEKHDQLVKDIFPDNDDDDDDDDDDGGDDDNADYDNEKIDSSEQDNKKRKLPGDQSKDNKKLKVFDDEAEESEEEDNKNTSGDKDGDGEESEEEDNVSETNDNEYQYDGFVVPENLNDDSDDESVEKRKAPRKSFKKLKKTSLIQLDEDDLILIEDNAKTNIEASTAPDDEEADGSSDEDENDDVGKVGNNAAIKGNSKKSDVIQPISGYDEDEDEDDGFIDNDDFLDEEKKNQEEISSSQAAQRMIQRKHRRREGPTQDQIQEVQNIFGSAFDGFDDDDEYAEEEEGVEEDGGGINDEKKARDRVTATFDRHILLENFCTEKDDVIRFTDRPERYQDILFNRDLPDDQERQDEAEWMAEKLVHVILSERGAGTSTVHPNYFQRDITFLKELIQPIQKVLHFYQVEQLEPPFVWLYRKDYLHPRMRRADLWKILSWDEHWERLYSMKQKLLSLLQSVKDSADSRYEDKRSQETEVSENRQKLKSLAGQLKMLQSRLALANIEYNAALDIVDEKLRNEQDDDENDHKLVAERNQVVENLKEECGQCQAAYDALKKKIQDYKIKSVKQSKFHPDSAAEVLRLFPPERYATLIQRAKDETELKDISEFFFILLKDATANAAANASAAKKLQIASTHLQTLNINNGAAESQGSVDGSMKNSQETTSSDPNISPSQNQTPSQYSYDGENTQKSIDSGEVTRNYDNDSDEGIDVNHDKHVVKDAEEMDQEEEEVEVEQEQVFHKQFQRLRSHKQLSGVAKYEKFRRAPKLREYIEMFTVPACEFGDSLRFSYKVEPPPTPEYSPNTISLKYSQHKVFQNNPDVVTRAVTNIVAIEYSHEPNVKRAVREILLAEGTISTTPSEIGKNSITAFSELFGLHYLENKPIGDFLYGKDKTLFLRLYDAEKNGLIKIHINLPKSRMIPKDHSKEHSETDDDKKNEALTKEALLLFVHDKKFMSLMSPSVDVRSDSHPHARAAWDQLRIEVLRIMFKNYLFPSLLSEIKRELIQSARDAIINETSINFTNILSIGGFGPVTSSRDHFKKLLTNTPKPSHYSTAVAIYLVNGMKEPICLCYLDKEGQLKASMVISDIESQTAKNNKIKQFLTDHQPEIIVINSSGGFLSKTMEVNVNKNLLPDVCKAVNHERKLKRQSQRYDDEVEDEELDAINNTVYQPAVGIVKDELANIFKRSARAKKLFPDLIENSAAAISLARYAQEPLIEFCGIWTAADAVEVFGFEALFLDLHPLKGLLKGVKLPLLTALERCLVDAVCDVGVDVNKAINYDHLAPMLAFVSGMGLRKADALRQQVKKTIKYVDSRDILLTRKIMGPTVWINAIGFLRITNVAENIDKVLNPLDNTRIHPECYNTYEFTQKICCDAAEVEMNLLNYFPSILEQMGESKKCLAKKISNHIEWLDEWEKGRVNGEYKECTYLKNGTKEWKTVPVELDDALSLLVLDEYENSVEQSGKGKRHFQFEHIKEEIRYPWVDLRKPMTGLTDKDMFTILTGESDQSLYVGLKLGCHVLEIKEFSDIKSHYRQMARVKTDIGMNGTISQYEVVEGRIDDDRFNMADHIQPGTHILAVVVNVNKERRYIDLSIRPSYLSSNESWWLENRNLDKNCKRWYQEVLNKDPLHIYDQYFNEKLALETLKAVENSHLTANKSGTTHAYQTDEETVTDASHSSHAQHAKAQARSTAEAHLRQIHHPLFANCGFREAEERLTREGKGAGEVIIRPSSKGPNMLAITWAFQENWYKHIDVEELEKKEGSRGLGAKLVIKEGTAEGEVFTSLDEIYARYVEPMNDFVASMINNRYFRAGSPSEVEASLRQEIERNPDKIPYCIRFEPNEPGKFVLTWINKMSKQPVKTAKIKVIPQGYQLQEEVFSRPSELVDWFKKVSGRALLQQRSAAAATASSSTSAAATSGSASGNVVSAPTSTAHQIFKTLTAAQPQQSLQGLLPTQQSMMPPQHHYSSQVHSQQPALLHQQLQNQPKRSRLFGQSVTAPATAPPPVNTVPPHLQYYHSAQSTYTSYPSHMPHPQSGYPPVIPQQVYPPRPQMYPPAALPSVNMYAPAPMQQQQVPPNRRPLGYGTQPPGTYQR